MDYKKNIFAKQRGFLPRALGNLFVAVCLYLVVMMYAFSFIYVGVNVDGKCMEDLYHDQDIVYYLPTQNVTYGDVVVFKYSSSQDYMKRIIAMEGDRINFNITQGADGENIFTLTLNGKPLIEPYVKAQKGLTVTYLNMYEGANSLISRYPSKFEDGDGVRKDYVVGEGEFFALGDNRAVSLDSSRYGAFKFENIKGKVEFYSRKNHSVFSELFLQFFWPFD